MYIVKTGHDINLVKVQCLWDVAIKMDSSIGSTNVLVANLKPIILYILGTMATLVSYYYVYSM